MDPDAKQFDGAEKIEQLYIADADYLDCSAQYAGLASRAQDAWNRFTALSQEMILDEKIIDGNRATSYADFIGIASDMIGQSIEEIMQEAVGDMDRYIDGIDQADQCLY